MSTGGFEQAEWSPCIPIRIASNIILSSPAGAAAAAACHVTLAGGGDDVVDDSVLHNNSGSGVITANDIALGRTIVEVLRGTN